MDERYAYDVVDDAQLTSGFEDDDEGADDDGPAGEGDDSGYGPGSYFQHAMSKDD